MVEIERKQSNGRASIIATATDVIECEKKQSVLLQIRIRLSIEMFGKQRCAKLTVAGYGIYYISLVFSTSLLCISVAADFLMLAILIMITNDKRDNALRPILRSRFVKDT